MASSASPSTDGSPCGADQEAIAIPPELTFSSSWSVMRTSTLPEPYFALMTMSFIMATLSTCACARRAGAAQSGAARAFNARSSSSMA